MAWDQQGAFPSLGGGASAGGQTASIFAALALAPTSKPRTAAATAAATASAAAPTPDPSLGPLGYFVTGSKKGAFPVGLEKRGCGKKVTVVKNVVGDAGALLQALKKRLGCGGVVCPGGSSVEVQGERKAEVERFLADAGCVKAVSGAHKAAAAPAKAGAQKVAAPTRLDRKFAPAGGGGAEPAAAAAAAAVSTCSRDAAKRMKPPELKEQLKAAGLPTVGNKKELLARLLAHLQT